jgi:hypothetical protein
LVDKINKKLPIWKCKLLLLGGRLVLLNFVLSVIPLYYLTLFKVSSGFIVKIDPIRKRFLWADFDILRKKYHLVKWDIICRPKEHRGWGVLKLEYMNIVFFINGSDIINILIQEGYDNYLLNLNILALPILLLLLLPFGKSYLRFLIFFYFLVLSILLEMTILLIFGWIPVTLIILSLSSFL